jgi:uncharacterized protein YdaU (DUF1376 family)
MHYYQHHIGDYRKDTSHLSLLEHGIYRQLLDLYYITEKPLDAKALRLICARTDEEQATALQILEEFFIKKGNKYYHTRCDDEIIFYHGKKTKATASAKIRWSKNKDLNDANALQADSEGNANHKPITNNQEPLTTNQQPSLTGGEICAEIVKVYKQNNIAPIDVSAHNPTFTKLVEANATVDEFIYAINVAISKKIKKPFSYAMEVLVTERDKANDYDLSKTPIRTNTTDESRRIAAGSIFTPEITKDLTAKTIIEKEVTDV